MASDTEKRFADKQSKRANIGRDVGSIFGGVGETVGGGIHDFWMGKDPVVTVGQESTLTPEQNILLQQLIAGGRFNASAVGGANNEMGLALDDLAKLRSEIASGKAAGTFGAVADRAQDPEARAQYFKEQSAPLEAAARENLKGVGRGFSDTGFFSSDRQAADLGVQKAFTDAQAKLMSDIINQDEDRALTAATGLNQVDQTQLAALQTQLQGAISSGQMDQAAEIQNQLAQLQSQQLYQQLLGVQGVENIVLNEGGTGGQGGGILGGIAGKIAGGLF